MSAMPINRRCGYFFLKTKPRQSKRDRFRRVFPCLFKHFGPVLSRILEESVAVDVIHEHDSDHCGQS